MYIYRLKSKKLGRAAALPSPYLAPPLHTISTILRTRIRVRNQIAKNGGVWALTTQKGK
jgi:hypothetical protein